MKNLQNLNGVTRLSSAQQKETFGGVRPIKKCNSSCAGRPRGARCYYRGHCSCPGECTYYGECVPW